MRLKEYLTELKATKYEVDIRRRPENIEIWIYVGEERDLKNAFIVRINYETTTKFFKEERFNIKLNAPEVIPYWDINFKDAMGREDIQPKEKGIALRLFAALEKEIGNLIKNESPRVFRFRSSDSSDWRETIEPKDKGIAIRLFAAMEKEVGNLIKREKPKVFRFRVSDHSDSRYKLYKTIAKKIQKTGKYNLYTAGKQFWFIDKGMIVKWD